MSVALIVLGAIVTLNAVAVTFASHWHAGVIVAYAVGILLICCGLFADHFGKAGGVVRIAALSLTGIMLLGIATLFISGKTDTVDHEEDAVIVLGAGIIGEKPSRTLADRLNTAIAYHKENPDALIVVSGGQGADEVIPEALAMKNYLVSHGVAEWMILMEDRSTSTAENFAFSKAILLSKLGPTFETAFITSDFHVFRANHIAQEAGMSGASHAHSPTPWYAIIPNGIREMMAIVKTWLFD